jgi:hypothetical protein
LSFDKIAMEVKILPYTCSVQSSGAVLVPAEPHALLHTIPCIQLTVRGGDTMPAAPARCMHDALSRCRAKFLKLCAATAAGTLSRRSEPAQSHPGAMSEASSSRYT